MCNIFLRLAIVGLFVIQNASLWSMNNKMILLDADQKRIIEEKIKKNFLSALPSRDEDYQSLQETDVTYDTVKALYTLADERDNLLQTLSNADAEKLLNHKREYIRTRLNEEECDAWKDLVRFSTVSLKALPSYESLQAVSRNMLQTKKWNASWNPQLPETWMQNVQQAVAECGVKENNVKLDMAAIDSFATSTGITLTGDSPCILLNKEFAREPLTQLEKAEMLSVGYHEWRHIWQGHTFSYDIWRRMFLQKNYWKNLGKTPEEAFNVIESSEPYKKWRQKVELAADVLPTLDNEKVALSQIISVQGYLDRQGTRDLYKDTTKYFIATYRIHEYLKHLKTENNVISWLSEDDDNEEYKTTNI